MRRYSWLSEEPCPESRRAEPPAPLGLGPILLGRVDPVDHIALGGGAQQSVDTVSLDALHEVANVGRREPKLADEPLQITDERFFIGQEVGDRGATKACTALDACHECLGEGGQLVEPEPEVGEREVCRGLVDRIGGDELRDRLEQCADVAQRRGLELAGARQALFEHRDRALGSFALRGQLVEEPRAIELFDRGDVGGVGVSFEVAPFAELQSGAFSTVM